MCSEYSALEPFAKLVCWWELRNQSCPSVGRVQIQGERRWLWQRQMTGLQAEHLERRQLLPFWESLDSSISQTGFLAGEKSQVLLCLGRDASSAARVSWGGDGSWSSCLALSMGFAECLGVYWMQPFPQVSVWWCLESGKMTRCLILLCTTVDNQWRGDSRRGNGKCCISALK